LEHLHHELSQAWVWLAGLAVLALAAVLGRRALRSRAKLAAGVLLVAMSVGVVPSVDAHEGHDHAEEAAAPAAVGGSGDRPMRLADGSLFVPKTTQRILAVRTLVATEGATPLSMRLAGEIVGDPRASAALQTVQGGRVTSAGREWPTLGAKVRRGQVLLRLTPTGSGGERATTAAESARVTQELARARADLARLEGLEGVVSRAELEAARSQVASLSAQHAALAAPLGSGEVLTSPIDGIIASIDASPGAVVQPGQSLVTIIDPARLSVEALAFEPVVGGASAISRATVALRDGTTLDARIDGIGSQLKGGAISVRLNLTSVASGLAVGQPVVVFLERTVTASGLSLPVDALVRTANGDRIVYEKVSAERYMPRTVRVRQVSADRIAVVAGLEPNARVVVSGAPLLAQIR
jgi:RND family efflux transporter MFP subunit